MISNNPRKRKADVLGRIAESSSTGGRGSVSGWTRCPLCGRHSQKRYALGRGITAHLHAVHTPWKPGKAEIRKRRRLAERRVAERKDGEQTNDTVPWQVTWDPTAEEREGWDLQVLRIARELEEKASDPSSQDGFVRAGMDRNGNTSQSYRQSLPPFVKAAADGDLEKLQDMLRECASNDDEKAVSELLGTRDRNGSTAEHWAAGGGHLSCLRLLVERAKPGSTSVQKCRRRDGKTSLHYAARNGRVECIAYLLSEGHAVDEPSGDGTTPLHLACYGGHVETVSFLLSKHANASAENEWGCGLSHWVGMTKCESVSLCQRLQKAGVNFVSLQKQGHSALHKAAQRKNKQVIEWMGQTKDEGGAGLSIEDKILVAKPDDGGHRPSDIWLSMGGDEPFAEFIKSTFESPNTAE